MAAGLHPRGPGTPAGRVVRAVALAAVGAALAILPLAPIAAAAQEGEPPAPGASVEVEAAGATVAEIEERCLDLSPPAPLAAPFGRLAGSSCRVEATGPLASGRTVRWRWALYRHELALEAGEDTPSDVRELLPDTLLEGELVLFVGPSADEGGPFRPVWHHRVDGLTHFLHAPEAVALDAGALLVHHVCLTGTGGCLDHPYLLRDAGRVEPLAAAYRAELAGRLPEGWGTWKGIWLEPEPGRDTGAGRPRHAAPEPDETRRRERGERGEEARRPPEEGFEEASGDTAGVQAERPTPRPTPAPVEPAPPPARGHAVAGLLGVAGVHLPGDANCCPSFRATFRLRRDAASLHLDSLSVLPDPGGFAWEVEGARFGHARRETGEAALRELYGGVVRTAGIRLDEGRCAPGVRVFAGEPWAFEVAFADSAGARPAFARAVRPEAGPWHGTGRPAGAGTRVDWAEPAAGPCEPTESP